ncbi:MAG: lysylphosphatidylglycerol synthase transmembrane domain-containing protein [Chloroflexota bacterium]
MIRKKPSLSNLLWPVLLAALLWWALRHAPLADIWTSLRLLEAWQIAALLSLNTGIYLLVTLRWWIIVRAGNRSIAYWPLLGVRVAVFGVSYFTLGPQVGGEPLQVLFLQRKHGLAFTRATASVLMDKLLEFLANFILLALGAAAILEAGILSTNGSRPILSLTGLAVLMMWPPIHIFLMMRGVHPVSSILRALPFVPWQAKPVRFVRAAEWMAGRFCRRHLKALVQAVLVSLLAGIGMVGEYALILSFLHIPLPFWQTVAAWTAGWLAFLAPLPGGLGALEASQVLALGAFGVASASAIGVTLLMRGRDLLIGGLGLLIAGRGIGVK